MQKNFPNFKVYHTNLIPAEKIEFQQTFQTLKILTQRALEGRVNGVSTQLEDLSGDQRYRFESFLQSVIINQQSVIRSQQSKVEV